MFKIFSPKYNLFKRPNGWTKHGKVWNKAAHVKSHLALNERAYTKDTDSVIIEYEMVEVGRYPVQDWINEVAEKRIERAAEREERIRKSVLEYKRLQLEQLKKELGE